MNPKTNFLIIIFLILFIKCSHAQPMEYVIDYAPEHKNFCFEISFSTDDKKDEYKLPSIRAKYYLTSNIALRGTFRYSYASNNYDRQEDFTLSGYDTSVINTYRMDYHIYHLQGGIEFRPKVRGHFSPYFGVDLGKEKKSSEYREEEYQKNSEEQTLFIESTTVEDAWLTKSRHFENIDNHTVIINTYSIDERAYNSFTIKFFVGLDIYILKHMYAGFELGYLFENKVYLESTVRKNGEYLRKYYTKKDMDSGFNYANVLRVGFWF